MKTLQEKLKSLPTARRKAIKGRAAVLDQLAIDVQEVAVSEPEPSQAKAIGTGAANITPKETKNARDLPAPSGDVLENRQLTLFQTFLSNNDEQRDQLSNSIDLWDSMPRYSVSRQAMTKARIVGRFLEKHVATFQHRGRMYTRTMSPARVMDFDGKDRDFYPMYKGLVTCSVVHHVYISSRF